MSMSKKDYQALAGALYATLATNPDRRFPAFAQWTLDVQAVADVLAQDNPRFNRALFVEACETGRCKGMKQR